jgi:elongation factor P
MKQQANLIRAGQVIEHDGRRWTILKQQIISPGKLTGKKGGVP